jgi:DNA mismatch repair protein MutH
MNNDKVYNSESELLSHARLLDGKSLLELYGDEAKIVYGGKGGFGNKVEEIHYKIKNNNISEPDVANLGVEIKTNPLYQKLDSAIVPKQRVVLGMIDFTKLINEDFESSSYIRKNRLILFNMFLNVPEKKDYDYKFVLNDIIRLSNDDLKVIKKDWEFIREKTRRLDADNISQSDTDYLIAVTKGGKNQKKISYLGGKAKAKRRAFAYKQSFIKHLISNYEFNDSKGYFEHKTRRESRFKLLEKRHNGNIEKAILEKFSKFINMSDIEIAEYFNYQEVFKSRKDKARWHYNTSLILTGERKKNLSNHITEFSKSGLTVKTVRTNDELIPLEEVSFRTQDYAITKDSNWEESSLYEEMSRKFLWVVYKRNKKNEFHLHKIIFWVMPKKDFTFLKGKWIEYKKAILSKEFKPSYFMNGDSFYYLKIKDKKGGRNKRLGNSNLTSLGHWFRKSYVQNILNSN